MQGLLKHGGPQAGECKFHCDNAAELRKAAAVMHWALDTSTPYVSESNGVIDRQNGIVYEGLRTWVECAGLAPQFWTLAGEYFCDSTNIGCKDPSEIGLDRDCPYFRRFHQVWKWHRVPFGALVDFVPDAKWQRENVPKAGRPHSARYLPRILLPGWWTL